MGITPPSVFSKSFFAKAIGISRFLTAKQTASLKISAATLAVSAGSMGYIFSQAIDLRVNQIAVGFIGVAYYCAHISRMALPRGVRITSDCCCMPLPSTRMRPSMSASSHTVCRGHVLRQASMASA
jgi:hypothetical protein